jgi:hypothetical protein
VEGYILGKLGLNENELNDHQKKELNSFSRTFHGNFLKKRIQVARKISQLQLTTWGQNQISIPHSLLGTSEAPEALESPAAPSKYSTDAEIPTFSHSDLAKVMKENSHILSLTLPIKQKL